MADKGMEHYSLNHPDEPPSNTREKYARTSFLSSEFWKRNKDRIILCVKHVIAVCFIASGLIGWYLDPTERFLDFRPRQPKDADETLIWIKTSGRAEEQNHWVQDLDQFIKTKYQRRVYGGKVNDRYLVPCDFDFLPSEKELCKFELKAIHSNCSPERRYGYDVGRPCVLVRINPVSGWYPESYRNSTFPEAMPPDLKEAYDPRYVYISCDGVTPADRENRDQYPIIHPKEFPTTIFL